MARILVCLILACSGFAQETQEDDDQFFSGRVTASTSTQVTVVRTVLGKDNATRTFLITPETKVEGGRVRVQAQVTVRFVSSDQGDKAVHIIVRPNGKK